MKVLKRKWMYDKHKKQVFFETRETRLFKGYKRSKITHCRDRIACFKSKDLKGKSILDVGCSYGGMMEAALELRAIRAVGIDHNPQGCKYIRETLMLKYGWGTGGAMDIYEIDMENVGFWRWFKTKFESFDTSFFLAVWKTSTFAERCAILPWLDRLTKEVLYVEGHRRESHVDLIHKLILYTSFNRFELLPNCDLHGDRPLIRCSRTLKSLPAPRPLTKKVVYHDIGGVDFPEFDSEVRVVQFYSVGRKTDARVRKA